MGKSNEATNQKPAQDPDFHLDSRDCLLILAFFLYAIFPRYKMRAREMKEVHKTDSGELFRTHFQDPHYL